MQAITKDFTNEVVGGWDFLGVSGETWGCAIGGAFGATVTSGNPWGQQLGVLLVPQLQMR